MSPSQADNSAGGVDTASSGGGQANGEVPSSGELGAGSTSSLLFGQVLAQSPVKAVIRRLRAAIALGLLADGDRLPREADLAQRLGVTMFSVREALGVLRAEELITTRAGKNGGSFVSYGTDRTTLGSAELLRMSSTELRDVGDWRKMLASGAASLAAQRASDSSVNRLRREVERLAPGRTEQEARRAHGRFHIELAAAAQSSRMTRAELALYEEFDWLLGGVLVDEVSRRKASEELATIADAVARRAPFEAREASDRHSASIINALVKIRFAEIASQADPAEMDGKPISGQVDLTVSSIFKSLDTIASRVEEVVPRLRGGGNLRAELSRAVISAAADIDLDGLGYIPEPGVVPGLEHAIAWWHLTPQGLVVDDSHVLDPDRDDFYDYLAQEYYAVPRAELRPYAQGPYVDYGGTNDYSITFSQPVLLNGKFVGVAAADVPVASIERQLAPWLALSDRQCMVINAERRVIVSNAIDHLVGDVLPLVDGKDAKPVPPVGWSIIV